MEKLEVRNFLTIHDAAIEARRFTILIGPQASGKSIVAKLFFFFRDFLNNRFSESIRNLATKRDLTRTATAAFEEIFPKYAWSNQSFTIVYTKDDFTISLKRTKTRSSPRLDYSSNLEDLHDSIKSKFQTKLTSLEGPSKRFDKYQAFWQVRHEFMENDELGGLFRPAMFIPASRSFFANLQKNVFSFLANNLTIDPLIKQFGSIYEGSKDSWDRTFTSRSDQRREGTLRDLKQSVSRILQGEYLNEEDQDWIVSGKRKVNLANASSGQQEALPMLLVLYAWASYASMGDFKGTFFVEEPEAHLFPTSQKHLVYLFSTLYDQFGHDFLLTTHSPYVLTALNNLIMASTVIAERGKPIIPKVAEIIPGGRPIQFNDVCAYAVNEGALTTIASVDTNLIGTNVIDAVSDEFERVFDRLLSLRYTEDQ
jgi:hypothetical protein